MKLLNLISLTALIAYADACTQCPHPGTFTGAGLGFFNPLTPNKCDIAITQSSLAVSIPAKFFEPRDQSPCSQNVNITNVATGKTIQAVIAGSCSTCANNDIQVTTAAQAARELSIYSMRDVANDIVVAPDANPNHAPGTVTWTIA